MTIEEAVYILNNYWSIDDAGFDELNPPLIIDVDFKDKFLEAIDVVTEFVSAQQEAEKNEPLTLEELRLMVGKPVYMVALNSNTGRWIFINSVSDRKITSFDSNGYRYGDYVGEYGKEILSYRRPPIGIGE